MSQTNGHQYGYYPGCSLGATGRAYEIANQAIAETLGMTFEEIEDWNCCGATEYFSLNSIPAYSLVARNLSLAADQGMDELAVPCSACFLNLHKTDKYMGKFEDVNDKVNQALGAGGLHYDAGSLKVRHLLDVIVEDIGFEAIAEQVNQPLKGLRVAPYYGCLIVRPDSDSGYNPEYPTHLDKLLEVLGATVVDFPLKAHCCGGHMTQISEDVAYELIRRLLANASEYQADAIVTICPMCQLNLDAYQPQVNRMFGTSFNLPVLFFTQVMGLAFGLSEKDVGIGIEIVSAKDALSKVGQEEEAEERKPKRRDKKALPMPPSLS
jgi:heterodisulfide reductase subunit B